MGRVCMEKLASFNLNPEQWPYGKIRIIAISNSVKQALENLKKNVELNSGDISNLIIDLEKSGLKHAYIVGGANIISFLKTKLINNKTITQVPILLGSGKSLFGNIPQHVKLSNAHATAFANDFIHIRFEVSYLKLRLPVTHLQNTHSGQFHKVLGTLKKIELGLFSI
ncbi:MAG: hypothetical protein B7Y34_03940 [Methylophilales bacterium 16-45-9]|jgi:dihydrofolate reductase|nr:MAG: hypothetical protein B7Y34_03940 [Methylophilales bacterium 16-45-9]